MPAPFKANSIFPSILAADFGHLADEVGRIEAGGADGIHIDVMDGRFAPNFSLGPASVEAFRRATQLTLDVHLMIEEPGRYVEVFSRAGADHLTVHVEVKEDKAALLADIHKHGMTAGLALSPDTPFAAAEPYLDAVDLLLVMTVYPGFSGQKFLAENLSKIREARAWRDAHRPGGYIIQVDGGIDSGTITEVCKAGAGCFVAGVAVFGAEAVGSAIGELRELAERVNHGG